MTIRMRPLCDQQAAYTAVAICLDKSVKLEAVDSQDGAADAKSLLGQIGEALQVAAASLPADGDAGTG